MITRRVSACWRPVAEEWIIEWPDGSIEVKLSAQDVIAAVRLHDARTARRTGRSVTTALDWYGPEGFAPPA